MKNKILLTAIAAIATSSTHAQLTVKPGTTLSVESGTTLTSKGDVTVEAAGTLANEGVVEFTGDLNNVSTPELTGMMVANGSEGQRIDGADSFAIRNLHVNNASGVTLGTTLSITNTLNLERGVLSSDDTHPLHFTGNSLAPSETVDGYIKGTAILDSRYVTGSGFDFLGFEVTDKSGGEVGMVGLRRTTGEPAVTSVGAESSVAVRWEPTVESPSGSDLGNYDIALSWLPAFDNNKDLQSLVLYGTARHNQEMYVMLDTKISNALKVDGMSEERTYTRKNLDFVNRKFTLSGRQAINTTVPEISITTFPNPASDHITFLVQNLEPWVTDLRVKITDAYGKMFGEYIFPYNGNLITVNNLGFLPMGVYRAFISRGQKTSVVNFYKN